VTGPSGEALHASRVPVTPRAKSPGAARDRFPWFSGQARPRVRSVRKWTWSFRTKLTFGVIAVLLPVLLLLLYQFREERARRLDAVALDLQQSAHLVGQVVGRKLGSALELARTLGLSADLRSMDAARVTPFLDGVAGGRDEIANIVLFDPQGEIVAAVTSASNGVVARDRRYFGEVLTSRGPVLSTAIVDRILKVPVVAAAAPVEGERGEVLGVVKISLRLDRLAQRFAEIDLAPGQAVVIVDQEGMLALHTDVAEEPWVARDVSQIPVVAAAVRDGTTYTDSYVSPVTHDRRLAAMVRIDPHGWVTGVSWSLSAAFGPIEQAHRRALLLLGAIALASLVGALLLARYFTRPIARLAGQAHALGEGRLDRRSDVRTGDELEELGRAFDTMAERLEEEKRRRGIFISAIAHEMRNMMTPLGLASHMVLRRLDAGQAPEDRYVRTILNQAGRLDRLIADLSDMVHVEAGKFEVVFDRVDLVEVVQAVCQASAATSGRPFDLDLPPRLELELDRDRIAQVLTNLTSNAVKYSEAGTRISLRVEEEEEGARVTVADEGHGIPPEQLESVFAPYKRVHGNSGVRGLGLGLFICRAIVREHGGRLWAESEGLGRGSRFVFTLPRRRSGAGEGGAPGSGRATA
jgi:histidine kinase